MPEDDPYTQFMTVRAKPPPLTFGATLHWDGMPVMSQRVAGAPVSEPVAPDAMLVQWPPISTPWANSAALTGERELFLLTLARTTNWVTEASRLTFYLDPKLLLPTAHEVHPRATGTLLWVHGQRETMYSPRPVHPALLVHTAYASLPVPYAELVPHLPIHDPLLHHMALLLQAAVEAEGMAGELYAEVLADALAVHLLRRYALGRDLEQPFHGGLTPSKLHRVIAYILAHLEHKLSLAELASVVQISPAHFARLFKGATEQTPHKYVITCRMECAKHLLTETTLPLNEIGARIGYADQSHFTALFRQYVAATPKAYRDAATRA